MAKILILDKDHTHSKKFKRYLQRIYSKISTGRKFTNLNFDLIFVSAEFLKEVPLIIKIVDTKHTKIIAFSTEQAILEEIKKKKLAHTYMKIDSLNH